MYLTQLLYIIVTLVTLYQMGFVPHLPDTFHLIVQLVEMDLFWSILLDHQLVQIVTNVLLVNIFVKQLIGIQQLYMQQLGKSFISFFASLSKLMKIFFFSREFFFLDGKDCFSDSEHLTHPPLVCDVGMVQIYNNYYHTCQFSIHY